MKYMECSRKLLCLLFVLFTAFACSEDVKTLHEIPFIRDSEGRVLILRGMNMAGSAKSSEMHTPNFTADDVKNLSLDWGFNFSRFLIFWDLIEEEPGVYNQEYLDLIEERMDWFAEHGVMVMLDMHQDVYSKKYGFHGAPLWATKDDDIPFTLNTTGWFLNYFQPAVVRAFDNFFNYEGDYPELQDHYAAMWAAVAERFRDHPAVIGYDIMNEPHPGELIDKMELAGKESESGEPSRTFDTERLQPFYQRVIDSIREVDSDTWIMYEPRYGAPGNGFVSYIGKLDDPRKGESRIAYAPHMYSIMLEGTGKYDLESDTSIEDWEVQRKADMERQGCPVIMGEWGLSPATLNVKEYMTETMAMMDRLMGGWAYWEWGPGGWSIFDGDKNDIETADYIVLPYARRIAGEPLSFSFDPDAKILSLKFRELDGVSAPTEIYVPVRHYPDGWKIECTAGDCAYEWDAETEIMLLATEKGFGSQTLTISPK